MVRMTVYLAILLLVASISSAFDPPKGLNYGMSYDQTKANLDTQGVKVERPDKKKINRILREYVEFNLPNNYSRAKIKGTELLDKKSDESYLVYDDEKGLVAFQYIFEWANDVNAGENEPTAQGFRKCWVFFDKLKNVLVSKYGDPTKDEVSAMLKAKDMPSGTEFKTDWVAPDSSSISLVITRQTHNVIIGIADIFLVFLTYANPEYNTDIKDSEKINNDL